MPKIISTQELIIMEALWDNHPLFLSQIKKVTKDKLKWEDSTYLTYLRKLVDAKFISFEKISGNRAYFPLMQRKECMEDESRNLMSRMTQSSRKLFLLNMIKEGGLSRMDREELQDLIKELNTGD